MPKYQVITNQGTFEVESESEPTAQEVDAFIAQQQQQQKESRLDSRGRIMGMESGALAGGPKSSIPKGTGIGTGIDLALEAGLPMAGQAITAPLAETGITSLVGSGLSVLGNALAQGRRMMMGEQDKFSGGQSVQAGLTGAVPFLGPAEKGAGLLQIAANVGKNAALQSGAGALGTVFRSGIDEGQAPSGREILFGTALPAAFGTFGSVAANRGVAKLDRSRRILENADIFGAANVTPTPGMLLPEELASIEQKMARDKPLGRVAQRVDQTRGEMAGAINDIAGTPREGAEIFSDLKPLLGQVSSAEQELGKLNEAAIAARQKAQDKFRAFREQQAAQTADVNEAVRKDAEAAMNAEWNANLDSVLDNAQQLQVARVAGGAQGIDPATFRTLAREHVAMPLRAAFKERADQMYSLVNNEVKAFDAAPILDEVNAITKTASGRLPTDLQAAVTDIQAILGDAKEGLPVSLQDLRRARDQLMSRVDTGVPLTSDQQRLISGITDKIRAEVDRQAPRVFGEQGAEALRAANKYYAETRPLFDKPGVKVLFSTDPADEYTMKVIRGIQSSGINSDEYANVMALVNKIKETHPEQASAIEDLFKGNVRESIIFNSSKLDPQTGAYRVDGKKLADNLDAMGRVEGTLETFGFGNRQQAAELKRLFEQYPDAAKLTDEQWGALFSSDAFKTAASGKNLTPVLAPYLAASAADTQITRAAALFKAGKVADARKEFDAAESTLRTVSGDVAALRAKRDMLLRDPVAVALDNPNLPDSSYDAFAKAFFDPSPSKITNTELGGIVAAMENGPRNVRLTLDRLRERYIADRIANFRATPDSSQLAQEVDVGKVRKFFEGNPADASEEIARARVLLTPTQMNRLDEFAEAAQRIDLYERLGPQLLKPGTYDIPLVGTARRAMDAIADLYRKGEYNVVAKALMDPRKYAAQLASEGRAAVEAGQMRTTAGEALGRTLDDRN